MELETLAHTFTRLPQNERHVKSTKQPCRKRSKSIGKHLLDLRFIIIIKWSKRAEKEKNKIGRGPENTNKRQRIAIMEKNRTINLAESIWFRQRISRTVVTHSIPWKCQTRTKKNHIRANNERLLGYSSSAIIIICVWNLAQCERRTVIWGK